MSNLVERLHKEAMISGPSNRRLMREAASELERLYSLVKAERHYAHLLGIEQQKLRASLAAKQTSENGQETFGASCLVNELIVVRDIAEVDRAFPTPELLVDLLDRAIASLEAK